MNFTQRRERFRAILAGDRCVRPAPVHDAISAVMAEDLGFEIGFMPGPIAQATILAAPNHHMLPLTLSELAEHCRHMCRATSSISIYVGAQHGFGNALNVMRTVEELESAGVSCVLIDDHVEPVPFGTEIRGWRGHTTSAETHLLPLEEAVGRMKAALAARQDPSMVITVRCSGIPVGGVPEAIRRVNAYEEAGVDAVLLDEITNETLEAVHAETTLPLLGSQATDRLDNQFLAANGVRVGQAGNLTFRASVKAMYDTLKALREGKTTADLAPSLISPELLARATRQEQYNEWFKSFMT